MASDTLPKIYVPGQRLAQLDDTHIAGSGTYIRNGTIYSSLAGVLRTTSNADGKTIVSVKTELVQNLVPSVDSVVSARISNVNPRMCKCAILSINNIPLRETFRGMIRKEDVRATEKDKVEMYKSFRPGDIVLAKVLSLGDAHSYLLTTAENELGVVIAKSEAGVKMVPISWCEMQCPETLVKEHRKVARIQPQYLEYSKS